MPSTQPLQEGKFGPGTSSSLKIKRSKEFKATGNAIENKNRPEALYITISSWVKPKMSIMKAQAKSIDNPDDLAVDIMKNFESSLASMRKKLGSFFDSSYFDTSSIIFTYDFAASMAKPGKRMFIELEINVDTVNNIDSHDNPAPTPGTGKINNIPFKEFLKPMEIAVNKILETEAFSTTKSPVSFAVSKGAK